MCTETAPIYPPPWTFNGDADAPAFSPSILARYFSWTREKRLDVVCHSYVVDGRVQYLGDCTHPLAARPSNCP